MRRTYGLEEDDPFLLKVEQAVRGARSEYKTALRVASVTDFQPFTDSLQVRFGASSGVRSFVHQQEALDKDFEDASSAYYQLKEKVASNSTALAGWRTQQGKQVEARLAAEEAERAATDDAVAQSSAGELNKARAALAKARQARRTARANIAQTKQDDPQYSQRKQDLDAASETVKKAKATVAELRTQYKTTKAQTKAERDEAAKKAVATADQETEALKNLNVDGAALAADEEALKKAGVAREMAKQQRDERIKVMQQAVVASAMNSAKS